MKKEAKDETVRIMKLLYDWNGEVVVSISEETSSLFINGQRHEVNEEAIDVLIETEIIEKDGGCEEDGVEEFVFTLTPDARKKINEILKEKLSYRPQVAGP